MISGCGEFELEASSVSDVLVGCFGCSASTMFGPFLSLMIPGSHNFHLPKFLMNMVSPCSNTRNVCSVVYLVRIPHYISHRVSVVLILI